jgi:hypothetical protein
LPTFFYQYFRILGFSGLGYLKDAKDYDFNDYKQPNPENLENPLNPDWHFDIHKQPNPENLENPKILIDSALK